MAGGLACEWDTHHSKGLIVKRGETVLVDDNGTVFDELPHPRTASTHSTSGMAARTTACRKITPKHGQDVVIDPAGVAYSVRLHLAQHLHANQRLANLEATVADLQGQLNQQRRIMHDLRRENFVTQGAFMAAQLCKADKGAVKFQRGKLDLVCKLLVSAGVFDECADGGLSVRQQDGKQRAVPDNTATDNTGEPLAQAKDIAHIEEAVGLATDEAQRASNAAAQASAAVEEVATRCGHLDEISTAALRRCSGLEENLKEDRQRIETNSTRIFRLAAEVERLSERESNARKLVAKPLASVEQAHVFPEEATNLAFRDPSAETALSEITPEQALEGVREGGSEVPPLECDLEAHSLGPGNVLSRHEDHAPRHPGVLAISGLGDPVQVTRAARLSNSPKHGPSPTGWRRSTYLGLRETSGTDKERLIDPVRPPMDRPCPEQATPNSWARASWPLLAKEVGHGARAWNCGQDGTDPNTRLVREQSMPNLTLRPTRDKPLRREEDEHPLESPHRSRDPSSVSRGDTDPPRHMSEAVTNRGGTHSGSGVSTHSERGTTSEQLPLRGSATGVTPDAQPSHSTNASSLRGARRDLGDALTSFPVSDNNNATYGDETWDDAPTGNQGVSSGFDGARTGFRGARLARLEGAPKLWCPRDTWDIEDQSPSAASSSTGGRGDISLATTTDVLDPGPISTQ